MNQRNGEFYLHTELLENLSEDYIDDFAKRLELHPNKEALKRRFLVNREHKTIVHVLEAVRLSEVEDLTDQEIFFYPLCSKEEIRRISNPKTPEDFLLKFRAEQIVDDPRLSRVFLSIRKKTKNWNFSDHFRSSLFKAYVSKLPKFEKQQCRNVTSGTIYLNEANGYCMKTPFGNVVVVSYALRYFLYYMNLFYYADQFNLDGKDKFYSLLIGVRTMLGTESLDFEIDKRGHIPNTVHSFVNKVTLWQLQFIIGHEFAHHYLNHLNEASFQKLNMSKSQRQADVVFYNYDQKLELDADYYAIMKPRVTARERHGLANGAFIFFFWLDIYETVAHFISPPSSKPATHPKPVDRIKELRHRLPSEFGFTLDEINEELQRFEKLKKHLLENFLPFHVEEIEMIGSMYLPSYKKEILFDRLYF